MHTQRFLLLLTLFCAVPALCSCVGGGSSAKSVDIEQQVQQHDMQLKQLQPSQADVYNQLQAMRQELNSIKGQMDDFQQAGGAQAITDRISKQDAALRQVETTMAMDLGLGEPARPAQDPNQPLVIPPAAAGATAQPVYPQGTPMSDATAQAAQAGQLPTYGQPASGSQITGTEGYAAAVPEGVQAYQNPANPLGQRQQAQAPSATTWGQPSPQPTAPAQAAPKDTAQALFDAGVNSFNARQYDAAQRSFSDFLKNFKDNAQVPKAQYYLAECYFQRNEFGDAALAYDTVIKKYPKSSSAPGAYLKQGISFSKLNQGVAAKARMQELIKKFPNSPEAARAKTFLKTNK